MEEIELLMNRVENALDAAKTKNYRVFGEFLRNSDEQDHGQNICDRFRDSHLVAIRDGNSVERSQIIVSNTNCNISGSDPEAIIP